MNYNNSENTTSSYDSNTQPPPSNHDETMNDENNNSSLELRPIFFGNLIPVCRVRDIDEIFERPVIGSNTEPIMVDRIDLKRGFGFVFLKDARNYHERDRVEQYVNDLNGMDIPNVSKALRSEFARGDGKVKRKEDMRRKNIEPNETLFVVNFHEETTRKEDLEMLFSPYGNLIRIDMKKNYAFVQFASTDQAKRAKDATNGGKLDQSVITVEYVARRVGGDDDYRRRRFDRSPRRSPGRRSPRRFRDDYRGSSPRRGRNGGSPDRFRDDYDRKGGRGRYSPDRYRDEYDRKGGRGRRSRSRSRSPFRRDRGRKDFRDRDRGRDRYDDRSDDRGRDRAAFRSDDRGYGQGGRDETS